MNLYLITKNENNRSGTYNSAVIVAKSRQDAKQIFPKDVSNKKWIGTHSDGSPNNDSYDWWSEYRDIDCIKVEFLGITLRKRGVVLASFNAGEI